MGLLDDAIREHLELKRRRGADADEVARQEDEALGARRRAEFAQPDGPPADAAFAPVPAEEEPVAAVEAIAAPVEPEPQPEPQPEPEPWLEPERSQAEPEPEPEPQAPEPEPRPAGEEDVLEETPDFLQETPEHDRLWFEQKPPRDFDFDS